jgi:TolA-binding protein
MTDPLDPLPPDVSELFERERRAPGLPAGAKSRLLERLALLGPIVVPPVPVGPAGGGGDLAPAAGAATAAGSTALGVKIATIALALGLGGIGGAFIQASYAPLASSVAPTSSTMNAAAPARIEDATAVDPPAADVSREGAPSVASATPAPSASPSASVRAHASDGEGQLGRERASLEVARTALTRGDFDAAASALDRHTRDFPRGQLAEERESMRVQVLVGQRRYDQARETAARFRKNFPQSLLQQSVNAAIATIP